MAAIGPWPKLMVTSTVPVTAGLRFVGALTSRAAGWSVDGYEHGVVGVDSLVSVLPLLLVDPPPALSSGLDLLLVMSQIAPPTSSTPATIEAMMVRCRRTLFRSCRRTSWRSSFRLAASRRCWLLGTNDPSND